MGGFTRYANLASEVYGCKPCLYSFDCEDSHVEHKECTSGVADKFVKAELLRDVDIFSFNVDGDLVIEELGIAIADFLNVHDTCETIDIKSTSNQSDVCNQKEMQCVPLDTDMFKGLRKCETILCSEEVQSYPLSVDVKEGLSSTVINNESPLEDENPTNACSMTEPATRKILSAMKGSRPTPPKTKLSVKWAPEVYDPPVTSGSHTVKGYHQRSRAKKDHQKPKHNNKVKPSRGSGGDKRHVHRRSSSNLTDPRILRLRALRGGLPSNGFGQLKAETVDYAIRSHESIRRISCCMESPPQVSLCVAAEASCSFV